MRITVELMPPIVLLFHPNPNYLMIKFHPEKWFLLLDLLDLLHILDMLIKTIVLVHLQ